MAGIIDIDECIEVSGDGPLVVDIRFPPEKWSAKSWRIYSLVEMETAHRVWCELYGKTAAGRFREIVEMGFLLSDIEEWEED